MEQLHRVWPPPRRSGERERAYQYVRLQLVETSQWRSLESGQGSQGRIPADESRRRDRCRELKRAPKRGARSAAPQGNGFGRPVEAGRSSSSVSAPAAWPCQDCTRRGVCAGIS